MEMQFRSRGTRQLPKRAKLVIIRARPPTGDDRHFYRRSRIANQYYFRLYERASRRAYAGFQLAVRFARDGK